MEDLGSFVSLVGCVVFYSLGYFVGHYRVHRLELLVVEECLERHSLQLVEQRIAVNDDRRPALLGIVEDEGNPLGTANNGYRIYREEHCHWGHRCKVLEKRKKLLDVASLVFEITQKL